MYIVFHLFNEMVHDYNVIIILLVINDEYIYIKLSRYSLSKIYSAMKNR